jgi:pyridoxine 5-phosphate synthase
MTRLSVNVNKIATLRNARGGDMPNLVQTTKDLESFGAQGITIHPRPDERHIRYQDAYDLKEVVQTELNIEGNPIPKFVDLALAVKPTQVTLVPDAEDAITSNAGWDTIQHKSFLTEVIQEFKSNGIRTSIFIDPDPKQVYGSKATGTDRIELYTEAYANEFLKNPESSVAPYAETAKLAVELEIGLNAGHDLNLQNIAYFRQHIPNLLEVSIGHAIICESLYFGFENVVNQYRAKLE